MREESHLEEMRAAVRGDRERAEQARLRSSENVRALVAEPSPERAPQSPPQPPPEPAAGPKRSLLGRLFGR